MLPRKPAVTPVVLLVMSASLTPTILMSVANEGLAAATLLVVMYLRTVVPTAAPLVSRSSPVFNSLLPGPNAVTNGNALNT